MYQDGATVLNVARTSDSVNYDMLKCILETAQKKRDRVRVIWISTNYDESQSISGENVLSLLPIDLLRSVTSFL
jgi:hypothetical protein